VELIPRHIRRVVEEYLDIFRVVVVNGPRQSGKSTLLGELHAHRGGTLISLDDPEALALAREDPLGLLTDRPTPLFVDEAQLGGDGLVRAVKLLVDRSRKRGEFVLSGSTRFLTAPNISESLTGRAGFVNLWPFSQGELGGRRESFLDVLGCDASGLRARNKAVPRPQLLQLLCRGGFPEVVALPTQRARRAWINAYVKGIVERDLPALGRFRRTGDLPRIVNALAATTAQELNVAHLARRLGMDDGTLSTYVSLAETLYLVHRLPAWSANLTAKAVRRPKIHFVDSGLAATILNTGPEALIGPQAALAGPLLETFVVGELVKQQGWAETEARLAHFRDRDGAEVDVVVEFPDGRIAAIEVKASVGARREDVRSLELLRDRLGTRFVHGVLLHARADAAPLGERITALPVSALWMTERS